MLCYAVSFNNKMNISWRINHDIKKKVFIFFSVIVNVSWLATRNTAIYVTYVCNINLRFSRINCDDIICWSHLIQIDISTAISKIKSTNSKDKPTCIEITVNIFLIQCDCCCCCRGLLLLYFLLIPNVYICCFIYFIIIFFNFLNHFCFGSVLLASYVFLASFVLHHIKVVHHLFVGWNKVLFRSIFLYYLHQS